MYEIYHLEVTALLVWIYLLSDKMSEINMSCHLSSIKGNKLFMTFNHRNVLTDEDFFK